MHQTGKTVTFCKNCCSVIRGKKLLKKLFLSSKQASPHRAKVKPAAFGQQSPAANQKLLKKTPSAGTAGIKKTLFSQKEKNTCKKYPRKFMEHARNSAPHYSPRVGRIVKNGKVLGLCSNSSLRRFSQLTWNSLSFEEWTFTVTAAVADNLRKYAPSLTELCLWAVFQMCPDLCNFWFSPLTSHTHTHTTNGPTKLCF